MQRYFVKDKTNNQFILSNDDSYHILTVMRMNINDKIEVINNKKLYICKIINTSNKIVTVEILEELPDNNELPVDITLVQSLVKEQKMDYIIQKTTEIGIKKIYPLKADRSVIKVDKKETKKLDRWQKIVKEASEQSKRNIIPTINNPITINELIKLDYDCKILLTVNEISTNLKKVLEEVKVNAKIIIVVGPEGGFTEEEERKMIDNGFISTSLGKSVLRTETAGLYVLSAISYHFMG